MMNGQLDSGQCVSMEDPTRGRSDPLLMSLLISEGERALQNIRNLTQLDDDLRWNR